MTRYALILLMAIVTCGCHAKRTSALFPGRWSLATDIAEYHGVYVFEFANDGKLMLEDYTEGFKPGDPPASVTQAGRYSFLKDSQLSIQDTNGQERAVYRIDDQNICLVYLRGIEKGDLHLVRPAELSYLYSPR